MIQQGDIYWVQDGVSDNTEGRIPHPHVVIQDDALNQDPTVATVTLCAVTTNAKKLAVAGNVLLYADEANLPRQSIVEVSKVVTIDKSQLGDYIGTLSKHRLEQIRAGMRFVQRSYFSRGSID